MLNKKAEIYGAIKDITENVGDTYPNEWENLPAIQYVEEENRVHQWADNREQSSYVRYKIDIWDKVSTSGLAVEVDKRIAALGFKRTQCTDVDDPNGYKHKVIRYEGIINIQNERVIHT